MATGIAIRKLPTVGVVPKSIWRTSRSGSSTRSTPTATSSTWVMKSAIAKPMFTPADSLTPKTFRRAEQGHHHDPADDVPRRLAERRPEDPEVVRHEERRDRDRDDVGEHLAPRREEGPELVEGAAGEARRSARPPGTSWWPRRRWRRWPRRSARRSRTPPASCRRRRSPRGPARSRSSCRRCRTPWRTGRPCRAPARAPGSWV